MKLTEWVHSTEVTFIVDDGASVPFQRQVKKMGVAWVKEARNRLTRALNYSARALVEPTRVAAMYWDLLYMYFGLPRSDPSTHPHLNAINTINAKIGQTLKGLSGDLIIADLSQMPGIAKAQFNCMNAINSALGREGGTLAGLVFVDVVEMATRYVRELWKGSSASGFMNPYAGPIHLNFEALWSRGDRSGVVTLIHEGTHKFAQTTDEQYFPEASGWDLIEKGIEACRPMIGVKYNTFDELLEDARKLALLGDMGAAVKNVAAMVSQKAINNADGVANYVYEIAEFETSEEMVKTIKRIISGRA